MPRVKYPQFELMGPPCRLPPCNGVLINTFSMRLDMSWRQCHKCNAQFDHKSAQERMAESIAVIEKMLAISEEEPD